MTKEKLIEGLNQDLAAELGTILRYVYHASQAKGFDGLQLRQMLGADLADELGHAQYLADKIVALGGEPTTQPESFQKGTDLPSMLRIDLEHERSAVENYKKRAEQADAVGDVELKVKLEDIAADETRHAEDLERLLAGM
jgi:bacterioferritin